MTAALDQKVATTLELGKAAAWEQETVAAQEMTAAILEQGLLEFR